MAGVVDRCRCYRHFGAKSRSPGVAGCEKERVIVPGPGRRNCLIEVFWFRRTGFRLSVGIPQFLALAK
jgi:hypothetical protein